MTATVKLPVIPPCFLGREPLFAPSRPSNRRVDRVPVASELSDCRKLKSTRLSQNRAPEQRISPALLPNPLKINTSINNSELDAQGRHGYGFRGLIRLKSEIPDQCLHNLSGKEY